MLGNFGNYKNKWFFMAESEEIAAGCVRKWIASGVMPEGEYTITKSDGYFMAEREEKKNV